MVRVACLGYFNMDLPNEAFFPLRNRGYDHCKKYLLPILIVAVVRETYSFIKIMQAISLNYNWENGVKQIKITEENLSQSCILCQLLRTKSQNASNIFVYLCQYLPYICWVHVIYLIRLAFLKSPWWLVWIFCAPTPLNWKIKLRK